MVSTECELLTNQLVAPDHYVMQVLAPEIAREALPGQFVHLRIPRTMDPLLRRPLSVMLADKIHGHLRLLVRSAGRGTEIIVSLPPHAMLELLGPLGSPFPMPDEVDGGSEKDVLLVAGGVGVAPLVCLADAMRSLDDTPYIRSMFGASTEDMLVCWTELAARSDEFYVATEDGSAGEQGLITEVLAGQLKRGHARVVYGCGPAAMMAEVARMSAEVGVPCYCSFEQRMGCGVGACLSCAIGAADGGYLRVCKDGPVFSADRVDWEAIRNE